jgi:hypothetical protein
MTDLPATAPSPFLPGTSVQYAVDSTTLGLMKSCPRLYELTILEGWQPKGESIHLRFGIEYHTALQEYDVSRANGVEHEDAIYDCVAALVNRVWDWHPDPESKAGKYKNRNTIISLVLDYLDHFSDDPAETYIKADGKAAVELSFRFELPFGPKQQPDEPIGPDGMTASELSGSPAVPYLLCGHLDRVVRFNDQLLVLDHKTTTTTIGSYYFDQYEPDNQMTLYTLAGQIVLDTPIRGVVVSAAQVMLSEPNRFVRGFTYRTPDQIQEWLRDLELLLQTFESYARLNYYPMNDKFCSMYGGCKFRGICSKDPAVRERFLKTDFIKLEDSEKWNPLKSR